MTTNRRVHEAAHTARAVGAIGAAALGALLAIASPTLAQFAGRPSLANVSGAGVQGDADSWAVAVSADGAIVAFASDADNLVPLDTNGDTDVFVRDTASGITTRVSVNWQGKEAQGDSGCPSLSADARYVAFSSRAWNMPQGGENVGTPAWEVYLHDRNGPETIRLSAPLGGGLGTADSGCPAISADGRRVAFASAASDLVPDDTNGVADVFVYDVPSGSLIRVSVADDEAQANGAADGPAISADGNIVAFASEATNLTPDPNPWPYALEQVYARDLSAGTTERVSSAYVALEAPNGGSCCPEISADGRSVLFHSSARNLTWGTTAMLPERLFLRDRTTGVTDAIEPLSGFDACDFCDISPTKGAALSADGRFVAFLSGSFDLLPENPPFHQDQIYLQDRLTRRLRRVTVDPTGYPVNAYPCGGSSSTLALSADGGVLAFVGGGAAALGLPDSNGEGTRDVVRLEWTCDSEGNCRQQSLCPGAPVSGCEPAERSYLRIRRRPPLGEPHDRFSWHWAGAGPEGSAPFVDPTEGEYHLCVYAGETMNTQIDAAIPEDRWERTTKGWQRLERDGALGRVKLRSASKGSMVTILSSSPALDLPYLPLKAPHGVTVQLHESTTNRCWEAAFPASAVRVNTRGAVTPAGSTPGMVDARLR